MQGLHSDCSNQAATLTETHIQGVEGEESECETEYTVTTSDGIIQQTSGSCGDLIYCRSIPMIVLALNRPFDNNMQASLSRVVSCNCKLP